MRHQARTQLAWAGFGSLGGGLWISPHVEREEELRGLSAEGSAAELLSLRAEFGSLGDPRKIVEEAWDLDAVVRRLPRRSSTTSRAGVRGRRRRSSPPRRCSCTSGASSRSWTRISPRRCSRPAGRASPHTISSPSGTTHGARSHGTTSARSRPSAARPDPRAGRRSRRGSPRNSELHALQTHCARDHLPAPLADPLDVRRRRRTGRSARRSRRPAPPVGVPARPVDRLGQRDRHALAREELDEPGSAPPRADGSRRGRRRPASTAAANPGSPAGPPQREACSQASASRATNRSRCASPDRHSRRAQASAWTRCEPSSWRILRARWAIWRRGCSRSQAATNVVSTPSTSRLAAMNAVQSTSPASRSARRRPAVDLGVVRRRAP